MSGVFAPMILIPIAIYYDWRVGLPSFSEDLTIEKFIGNEEHVAVQMWAHFTALADDEASLFGPVKKGETFDFRGLILYDLVDGKFSVIKVAYNSFVFTDINGKATDLGIPH